MKHGSDIYGYAKKLGCKPEEIIDFSSNINLHTKPLYPKVDVVRYYDFRYKKLKETIAKRYKLKPSRIALFNGASSAIFHLLQTLPNKIVTLYAPLYGEYEKAAEGKKILKINRFVNLYKKPPKNSIVIFVNPATPDGRYYDLEKLLKLWRERNCTVILDESFLEFEKLPSYRSEIENYKKLYIIQSFSKFYACAGVRIGAVFSSKENIQKLSLPMWALSSFDAEFLMQRLQDKSFRKTSRKKHKKRKKELYRILAQHFEIFESNANFFLVKASKEVFEKLLKKKILVRKCGSFDYLDDGYLRFAVKDKKAHKKLKKALDVL